MAKVDIKIALVFGGLWAGLPMAITGLVYDLTYPYWIGIVFIAGPSILSSSLGFWGAKDESNDENTFDGPVDALRDSAEACIDVAVAEASARDSVEPFYRLHGHLEEFVVESAKVVEEMGEELGMR